MRLFEWIVKGLSAADGSMDDARIHAGLMVLSYIGVAAFGLYHTPPSTLEALGSFLKDFGIGGAALAAGLGAWFGIRKDN